MFFAQDRTFSEDQFGCNMNTYKRGEERQSETPQKRRPMSISDKSGSPNRQAQKIDVPNGTPVFENKHLGDTPEGDDDHFGAEKIKSV